MDHLLGIDVGTSSTKAAIFDARGRVAALSEKAYPMSTPYPKWAEQDPGDWWAAAVGAVREVIELGCKDPAQIRGVGFSGQMHGLVLLDEAGAPIRPCILWCDARTADQRRTITERVGEDRLRAVAGNAALEGFTAPKLLWVREREPELFKRARMLLLPKDYIRYRLTGEACMEVSDAAGTLLFDIAERRWSAEILDALGLDRGLLPPVRGSAEVCGEVSPEAASLTGLRAGTPVVGGAADNAAAAVGAGIVVPGRVSASIGSSGVVLSHADAIRIDPELRTHTFCHAVPDKWYVMGVMLAAGLSFRWLRDALGRPEAAAEPGADPYELMTRAAAAVEPGCEGLFFLPYLFGERTPHKDPDARGAFIGLTARHSRPHLIRSVMEGITFGLRDSLEIIRGLGLPVSEIRLLGGGARSEVWRRMQADIYGVAVRTVNVSEGACLGAAILAGVGVGLFDSIPAAVETMVAAAETYEPDPAAAERYNELYCIFRDLYPALKTPFARMSRL